MQTIKELLIEAGLYPREIGLLLIEIKAHNEQYADRRVQVPDLNESIDQILLDQLPFIGRAIAKAKGDVSLDSEGKFSLTIDENALRYAAYKLEKFYIRKEK
jgi:hypothetical protein